MKTLKTNNTNKVIKVYGRKSFIEKKSDFFKKGLDIVKAESIFNNGDVIGEYALFSNGVKICYYNTKSFTVTEKTEKKTENKKPTKKEIELKKCNNTLLPPQCYGFEGVTFANKKIDVVADTMKNCIDIIESFCEKHVKGIGTDYNDLKDYLINDFYNNYLKLCNSNIEVNEKTIYNAMWHAIKLLKLRYNNINFMTRNDKKTVTEKNKVGGGVDNGKYKRVIMSKYVIEHTTCITYTDIANCFTNKSLRNATLHGCFYVSVYNASLRKTLTTGLNAEDTIKQNETTRKVLEVLSPMFEDKNFKTFFEILKSEKTLTQTERKQKSRFMSKYPFTKELEKNDLIYLINTYSM